LPPSKLPLPVERSAWTHIMSTQVKSTSHTSSLSVHPFLHNSAVYVQHIRHTDTPTMLRATSLAISRILHSECVRAVRPSNIIHISILPVRPSIHCKRIHPSVPFMLLDSNTFCYFFGKLAISCYLPLRTACCRKFDRKSEAA